MLLSSHRNKTQRKKSEDEERRKRDEVLKELEVLNEECQGEEVMGMGGLSTQQEGIDDQRNEEEEGEEEDTSD